MKPLKTGVREIIRGVLDLGVELPTSPEKRRDRWILYILKCSDGSLYTGITNDLVRRLEKHNLGRASRYTRSRLPVMLVHAEGCLNKSSALKKELRIKALTRQEKENYLAAKSRRKDRLAIHGKKPVSMNTRG